MKARAHSGSAIPGAFTLTEMLISIAILALIVLFTTRLFHNATTATTQGSKRIEADSETRPVLDRMQIDVASLLRRTDLDYYLKDATNPQTGNDQIAFFSQVPGYYPSSGSQSPVSVVGYRINSVGASSSANNRLERLAKGLVWNGVSASDTPLVFLPLTIAGTWPTATNAAADNDYEVFGPQIFRFEYYYQLVGGNLTTTPWTGAAGHTAVNGLQDVVALEVAIALIDQKSRVLISDAQLAAISAALGDFDASGMKRGDLLAAWQATLNSTTTVPRSAVSAIRLAQRTLPISPR